MHRPILPTTARGRLTLTLFLVVIAGGLWPVVLIANQARLVLGIPAVAAWACLLVLASSAVMLIGNRLSPLPEAIVRAHDTEEAER
ncbi:hypothetical protein [Modicisalibacter coralii]|uniref:hypothetical protein n=1 Tax=Modicisalibacter coralii TaxID=2304602 RepID=UPI00100B30B6|nr:hypothetical protein [Halomonas coralii]